MKAKRIKLTEEINKEMAKFFLKTSMLRKKQQGLLSDKKERGERNDGK